MSTEGDRVQIPRIRRASALGLAVSVVLGLPVGSVAVPAAPLALTDCGPAEGVYRCSGLVETWDGVPLDTTVTLPSARSRNLPLVVELHGFGNSKHEYLDPASTAYTDNAFAWARDGYAVLTFTARGLWGSCGTPESRAASPAGCAEGYLHLADVRYEVRDAQELIGRLVDGGYAAAGRIGVTGDSYGGGQTLMLAALRDRVMLPDGHLVPWRSPAGRRLRIAAAAPVIPWSDVVTAAAPNGRVSPTGVTDAAVAHEPIGVTKGSFVNGIGLAAQFAIGPGQPVGERFVPGRPMGFLQPPGTGPEPTFVEWVARIDAGEPYTDPLANEIVRVARDYHSAYFIDPSRPPPPLFMASGFTDDLFPVDEVLRFANRTRRLYPRTPMSLFLGDFGHQRAVNKPAERAELLARIHGWFDRYLKGQGSPRRGVTAYVGTCPASESSLGPFFAPTFAGLARRELGYASPESQTVSSLGGDPRVAQAIDPATGSVCAETPAGPVPGAARYVVKSEGAPAWTLVGAPRVWADLTVTGVPAEHAQIAARLWDVAPGGASQRLVARGTYRPSDGPNAWWLHPAAWRFAKDHAAILELVGADAPYARPSNGAFTIEVHTLRVTLPAR
ncbi:MAG: CocE/NonD family hydrolase [Actinomycetota bacterium]